MRTPHASLHSILRLSKALCAAVGNFVKGSHPTLVALFLAAGAFGDPPALAHHSKWKDWLFRTGQDESTDSLAVLGNILEEFMDVPPADKELRTQWELERADVVAALKADGLSYFRGGRVLPNGHAPDEPKAESISRENKRLKPTSIEDPDAD